MRRSSFRFTRGQRRTLFAMSHVACPADLATLGLEGHVIDEVELTLASFPAPVRLALGTTLFVFEWLAILRPRSFLRPFSRLPLVERERWFAAWWHSPLFLARQAIKALKGLLGMAYYDLPPVKARLGYLPEQWIAGVKEARLANYGDEIRLADAAVTSPDPLLPAASLVRRHTAAGAAANEPAPASHPTHDGGSHAA
jgi:hypothetical protein